MVRIENIYIDTVQVRNKDVTGCHSFGWKKNASS